MPGLEGDDLNANHFGFTENISGSDLESYSSHLLPSGGARRKCREELWEILD